jgi:hypothetical protein
MVMSAAYVDRTATVVTSFHRRRSEVGVLLTQCYCEVTFSLARNEGYRSASGAPSTFQNTDGLRVPCLRCVSYGNQVSRNDRLLAGRRSLLTPVE